jgi:hypothetical protein
MVSAFMLMPGLGFAALGEDPGPVYNKAMQEWVKTTDFARNASKVIVEKMKVDMRHDPKMKEIMSPKLFADLEQFFYELFNSPEMIKDLSIVYAQYFSLDELSDMLKFYQSSAGQKLIKVDPELKMKIQQISADLLKKHDKEYMKVIGKYINKKDEKTKQE